MILHRLGTTFSPQPQPIIELTKINYFLIEIKCQSIQGLTKIISKILAMTHIFSFLSIRKKT